MAVRTGIVLFPIHSVINNDNMIKILKENKETIKIREYVVLINFRIILLLLGGGYLKTVSRILRGRSEGSFDREP